MQVDVNEQNQIRLRDVFEPVEFVSPNGESLFVCMRDGGFEIAVRTNNGDSSRESFEWHSVQWHSVQNGIIRLLAQGKQEA